MSLVAHPRVDGDENFERAVAAFRPENASAKCVRVKTAPSVSKAAPKPPSLFGRYMREQRAQGQRSDAAGAPVKLPANLLQPPQPHSEAKLPDTMAEISSVLSPENIEFLRRRAAASASSAAADRGPLRFNIDGQQVPAAIDDAFTCHKLSEWARSTVRSQRHFSLRIVNRVLEHFDCDDQRMESVLIEARLPLTIWMTLQDTDLETVALSIRALKTWLDKHPKRNRTFYAGGTETGWQETERLLNGDDVREAYRRLQVVERLRQIDDDDLCKTLMENIVCK